MKGFIDFIENGREKNSEWSALKTKIKDRCKTEQIERCNL